MQGKKNVLFCLITTTVGTQTGLSPSYLFLLLPQAVPHGRHDLRDFSKCSVGILSFNRRLRVPEEQRVGRNRFLRLFGVFPRLHRLPSCSSLTKGLRHAGGQGGERRIGHGGVEGDDPSGDGQGDRRFNQDALHARGRDGLTGELSRAVSSFAWFLLQRLEGTTDRAKAEN